MRGPEKEERRRKREGKKRKKEKGGKEIEKGEKKPKEKGERKGKGEGKIGKFFGKNSEIRKRIFGGISRFSGACAISGTAVMARRGGRRDRGKPGFPTRWPTAALGRHTVSGDGPSDGGRCRRDLRHARRGKERGER
jgi:hypothetical protein